MKNEFIKDIYIVKSHCQYICYVLRRIYKFKIFEFIRNSLLYNMIKVFLCILILLSIIYAFLPHEAYLTFESESVRNFAICSNFNNNNVELFNINRMTIEIMSDNNIVLPLTNVSIDINGKKYSGDYDIKIECDGESYISRQVVFEPIQDVFDVKMQSLENLNFGLLEESYQTDYLCTDADIYMQYPFRISLSPSKKSYISAYLVDGEDEIRFDNCIVDGLNKNEYFPYVSVKLKDGDFAITPFYTKRTKNNVSILDLNSVDLYGTGDVYFTYTLGGTEYDLHMQNLKLCNELGGIKCSFTQDTNSGEQKIVLRGNVENAYISEIDLFPSILGWFKENVYLAPLTLISTIFGGIAIKNKKEL